MRTVENRLFTSECIRCKHPACGVHHPDTLMQPCTRSHMPTRMGPHSEAAPAGACRNTCQDSFVSARDDLRARAVPSTQGTARNAPGFVAHNRSSQLPSAHSVKWRAQRVRTVSSSRRHPTTTPLSLSQTYCQHVPLHCQPPYLPPAHCSPGTPANPKGVPPGRLVYSIGGASSAAPFGSRAAWRWNFVVDLAAASADALAAALVAGPHT